MNSGYKENQGMNPPTLKAGDNCEHSYSDTYGVVQCLKSHNRGIYVCWIDQHGIERETHICQLNYVPTQMEIRDAAAEIRSRWTTVDYVHRTVQGPEPVEFWK